MIVRSGSVRNTDLRNYYRTAIIQRPHQLPVERRRLLQAASPAPKGLTRGSGGLLRRDDTIGVPCMYEDVSTHDVLSGVGTAVESRDSNGVACAVQQ